MRINLAHLRERSTSGKFVNFAIFDADTGDGTNGGRSALLADLTRKTRLFLGLTIDVSALAYSEQGQSRSYGDPVVVDYPSKTGVPQWTHYMDF